VQGAALGHGRLPPAVTLNRALDGFVCAQELRHVLETCPGPLQAAFSVRIAAASPVEPTAATVMPGPCLLPASEIPAVLAAAMPHWPAGVLKYADAQLRWHTNVVVGHNADGMAESGSGRTGELQTGSVLYAELAAATFAAADTEAAAAEGVPVPDAEPLLAAAAQAVGGGSALGEGAEPHGVAAWSRWVGRLWCVGAEAQEARMWCIVRLLGHGPVGMRSPKPNAPHPHPCPNPRFLSANDIVDAALALASLPSQCQVADARPVAWFSAALLQVLGRVGPLVPDAVVAAVSEVISWVEAAAVDEPSTLTTEARPIAPAVGGLMAGHHGYALRRVLGGDSPGWSRGSSCAGGMHFVACPPWAGAVSRGQSVDKEAVRRAADSAESEVLML
jgi:hypothetical protein